MVVEVQFFLLKDLFKKQSYEFEDKFDTFNLIKNHILLTRVTEFYTLFKMKNKIVSWFCDIISL